MTTPCELTAPEREAFTETVRALERRIDEVCAERDAAAAMLRRYVAESGDCCADRRAAEAERDALADRLAIAERAAREEREARIAAEASDAESIAMYRRARDRATRYRLRLARVLRAALVMRDEFNDWMPAYRDGGVWSGRALSGGKGEER